MSTPITGTPAVTADSISLDGLIRLEVTDLKVCIKNRDVDVVDDISFSVAAGEVVGLVGESGSGKTTVALAMLGHARRGLKIRGGQVKLDGTDLLRLDEAAFRELHGARVAYVPQDPASALNPALRIGTQLLETFKDHPGAIDTDAPSRVREVLAEARLDAARSCCAAIRTSSRAASSSGWRSPWPSAAARRSSCSTSRRPASTSPRSGTSSTPCGACAASTASPGSMSATTSPSWASW